MNAAGRSTTFVIALHDVYRFRHPAAFLHRQWAQAGLGIQDSGDYDVSPLLLLGTRTSMVVEETATGLR